MKQVIPLIFALVIPSAAMGQLPHNAADLEKAVERKIRVTENQTIFALFCLLNLGGYDEENNPAGMHPVRVRVRQELAQKVRPELAQRIREYYRQHRNAEPYEYTVVALSTGGPPDFKFTADWAEFSKDARFAPLADTPGLLRELYSSTPLDSIYAGVQAYYRKYIEDYHATVVTQVAKVTAYCRVSASALGNATGGETPHAVVIPNLLQSFGRAFGFVLGDTFYSIEGPFTKMGYNPHEFVHSITSPMSYDPRNKALQEPAEPLFELAKKQPDVGDVNNLQNFLDENLVRAICLRYLNNGDPARAQRLQQAMMQQYRSGYPLMPFFYEQLEGYEKSNLPLRDYYPTMLKNLRAKDELGRWERTAKDPAK